MQIPLPYLLYGIAFLTLCNSVFLLLIAIYTAKAIEKPNPTHKLLHNARYGKQA